MTAVLSRNEASLHQAVTALCGHATSQRSVAHSLSGGWVEVEDSSHDIDYSKSHIPDYDEDEEDEDDDDGIPQAPPRRHVENPYDSSLGVFMGSETSAQALSVPSHHSHPVQPVPSHPVHAAVHSAVPSAVHSAVHSAHQSFQPAPQTHIPHVEETYDFASYEHPFGVSEPSGDSGGGDSGECEGSFKTMSRKEKQDFFSANYQSLQEDPSDQNFRSLFGKGRGRTPKWKEDFREWYV
jgi:hypothetical protein